MFSMQQMFRSLEGANQVPLLVNNPPSTIWYSDKPPLLGGIPRRISIPEFMKIYTANGGDPFEYTETVWCDPAVKQMACLYDPYKKYEHRRPDFESYLRNPAQWTDKLIISFIDPEVGFGVFANEDIPPLSIIGIYSGVFTALNGSSYAIGDALNLQDWRVDAILKGGFLRFFQHLPTSLTEHYKRYRLFKEDRKIDDFFRPQGLVSKILNEPLLSFDAFVERYKKHPFKSPFVIGSFAGEIEISSENVGHDYYIMDGLPLFVFFNHRKIDRYGQLGFNYGQGYWNNLMKKSPCLFDMQSKILGVSHTCQKCNFTALKLLTCANCKEVYYCTKQCQKEDWQEHKKQCKK